jgi:hypothetical protein
MVRRTYRHFERCFFAGLADLLDRGELADLPDRADD